jgi:aryl-alcohol dehydrogenase-like predicted oxidoreductase
MDLRPEGYATLLTERTFDGIDALARAAAERGVSTAALALAWLLHVPEVTAIVVGPARPAHLDPVREALDLRLSDTERDDLERLFT